MIAEPAKVTIEARLDETAGVVGRLEALELAAS